MITPAEGRRATQFVGELLERSELYTIISTTPQEVQVKSKYYNQRYSVLLANTFPNVRELQTQQRARRRQEIYTCPILYKDGETAFRRLADCGSGNIRRNYGLWGYAPGDIQRLFLLTDIESYLLQDQQLWYYQPRSPKLPESLRRFKMHSVHQQLPRGMRQQVREEPTIGRPEELERIVTPISLTPRTNYEAQIVREIIRITAEDVASENLVTAVRAFKELDPEDALRALYGEPL